MEVEGIIIEVLPVREGTSKVTGKPWRIAEYVLETLEQYPKNILFQVSDGENGRIARLNIQQNARMRIHFDLSATKSAEGRWFNKVTAYDARQI